MAKPKKTTARNIVENARKLRGKERAHFVHEACGEDSQLHAEVLSLLVKQKSREEPVGSKDSTLPAAGQFPRTLTISTSGARQSTDGPTVDFRILELIGTGGMGEVYLAEQTQPVLRRVALKRVKLGMDSTEVLGRFEAERQALALMNHPHIARIYDAGQGSDGSPYFVMEYVPGLPLVGFCDKHQLNVRERLELLTQVCDAVQHAHQKGIVHRDLKPSNILVSFDGETPRAKIIDFGVAKATRGRLTEKTVFTEIGVMIGTLEYMSPEQANLTAEDVDTRADVYSLGVILYELLAGAVPFDVRSLEKGGLEEIRRIICEEDPPRPSARLRMEQERTGDAAHNRRQSLDGLLRELRGELDWIVLRALEKERNRRYDSAHDLAEDVERYLSGEPVEAHPPTARYRLWKFLKRHRAGVAAASVLIATLLTATLAVSFQYLQAEEEHRVADEKFDQLRRLSDLHTLQRVETDSDRLWPPHPRIRSDLEELRRRAEELSDRLPRLHRPDLEALRLHGVRDPEGGTWRFDTVEEQWNHDMLTELATRLESLSTADPRVGVLAGVDLRLLDIDRIAALSVEAPEALEAWDEARREILASERYGFRLEPQFGLVPLGWNEQGLYEFWHVPSGDRPKPAKPSSLNRWVIEEPTGMVFILIPGHSFWMGSQKSNPDHLNYDPEAHPDAPLTHRTLSPHFMSKYELNQAQWVRLTGENPSKYPPGTQFPPPEKGQSWRGQRATSTDPVGMVSCESARGNLSHWGLDLPTEAQWEASARAGTTTRWWSGELKESIGEGKAGNLGDAYARSLGERTAEWVCEEWDDGFAIPAPVGSGAPNPFGLHDTIGNVYETTRDPYGPYDAPHRTGDGFRLEGNESTTIARGGGYYLDADWARTARRFEYSHRARDPDVGIRPVRDLDVESTP